MRVWSENEPGTCLDLHFPSIYSAGNSAVKNGYHTEHPEADFHSPIIGCFPRNFKNMTGFKKTTSLPLLIAALFILLGLLSSCSSLKSVKDTVLQPKESEAKEQAELDNMTPEEKKKQKKIDALNEEITASPFLIDSNYFRETAGEGSTIHLFGSAEQSKKEKELEERLAKLEKRLQGLPERAKDRHGMPVLRRKVVLLSLLGDLGLDVLSLLPAALRRTDGIVPVDASQLAQFLKEQGRSVSELASAATRREVAAEVGIQAYILIYFPQSDQSGQGKKSVLRLDVIHATESVLIGSYLTTIDKFDEVAKKISADVVRATDWSCRIIKIEDNMVYLNAGRLTGLQPGDKLRAYRRGKEIMDPITKRSLGYGPGKITGDLEVKDFFGTDASVAAILSDNGLALGDIVKMLELAPY